MQGNSWWSGLKWVLSTHAFRKTRLIGRSFGWDCVKVPCYSRYGTIKMPPCSKGEGVKFCSPFDVLRWVKYSRMVRWTIINQSINQSSQAGNAGPMFEDSIHTSEFRKGARVKHQFCQNWIDFSLTLQIRINKNRL